MLGLNDVRRGYLDSARTIIGDTLGSLNYTIKDIKNNIRRVKDYVPTLKRFNDQLGDEYGMGTSNSSGSLPDHFFKLFGNPANAALQHERFQRASRSRALDEAATNLAWRWTGDPNKNGEDILDGVTVWQGQNKWNDYEKAYTNAWLNTQNSARGARRGIRDLESNLQWQKLNAQANLNLLNDEASRIQNSRFFAEKNQLDTMKQVEKFIAENDDIRRSKSGNNFSTEDEEKQLSSVEALAGDYNSAIKKIDEIERNGGVSEGDEFGANTDDAFLRRLIDTFGSDLYSGDLDKIKGLGSKNSNT